MSLSQEWCLGQACGAREVPSGSPGAQVAQQVAGWQQGQGGFAGPSVEPCSACRSDRGVQFSAQMNSAG